MDRKEFIKSTGIGALSAPFMSPLSTLNKLNDSLSNSKKMPALFLGHGTPMNAIEENEFVQGFRKLGKNLEKPKAIVVISAHWETRGTFVTAMEKPRTIHDFGGFPQLRGIQYPAPGNPKLAKELSEMIKPKNTVHLDHKWGLDHGSWTVVKHLYPEADVPVIQLSLDYRLSGQQHYALAQQLSKLREKGVLIIGSGNLVHNLWKLRDDKPYFGYDWAIEASNKMKQWILDGNHSELINFKKQGKSFDLAIPTPDHFLPLLYVLAIKDNNDEAAIFNDEHLAGSITMTSLRIGEKE